MTQQRKDRSTYGKFFREVEVMHGLQSTEQDRQWLLSPPKAGVEPTEVLLYQELGYMLQRKGLSHLHHIVIVVDAGGTPHHHPLRLELLKIPYSGGSRSGGWWVWPLPDSSVAEFILSNFEGLRQKTFTTLSGVLNRQLLYTYEGTPS